MALSAGVTLRFDRRFKHSNAVLQPYIYSCIENNETRELSATGLYWGALHFSDSERRWSSNQTCQDLQIWQGID